MQEMQGNVHVISAREFATRSVTVPPSYGLRFPAHWRANPVQNRYAAALEHDTLAWLAAHGIGQSVSEREKLRKFACGKYGGYSLPLAPFSSALLVTQFISLWLFWDDVQVEDDVGWSIEDVVDALSGAAKRTRPNRYVAAWADLGQRLQRTTSEAWLGRLAQTMREWLHNAKLETAMARSFRNQQACPKLEALFECRTVSIGMFPTFHLIELTEGIELPDEFHQHPAVCALTRIASRLVGMGNDLGGIAKDIVHRWLNLVLVLAQGSAISLERAFADVVALHNREVLAFDQAAALLPRFGPTIDPFVSGWVQAVRHNVRGFALWESVADRYQEYKAVVGDTALLAALLDDEDEVAR
jgi:hypothetical protein